MRSKWETFLINPEPGGGGLSPFVHPSYFSFVYRTIKEHDCNIFANMQKQDFRDLRNLLIEMVLHTDMSQHFTQLKAMKSILQQHNGEPR